MSQNNAIKKSDKKFIRLEKARIRRDFSDVKKQEELIDGLYARFLSEPKIKSQITNPKSQTNSNVQIAKPETEKAAVKEKPVKKVAAKKMAPKKAMAK